MKNVCISIGKFHQLYCSIDERIAEALSTDLDIEESEISNDRIVISLEDSDRIVVIKNKNATRKYMDLCHILKGFLILNGYNTYIF